MLEEAYIRNICGPNQMTHGEGIHQVSHGAGEKHGSEVGME